MGNKLYIVTVMGEDFFVSAPEPAKARERGIRKYMERNNIMAFGKNKMQFVKDTTKAVRA